jgi:hypothetical protein
MDVQIHRYIKLQRTFKITQVKSKQVRLGLPNSQCF